MKPIINPIFILLTAWALLVPAGLLLAIVKRKRKGLFVLGLVLMLVGTPPCLVMGPVCLWQLDRLRGWNLRMSVDVPPYTVTLVQKPGDDFYHSSMVITKPDGRSANILIDADDARWWHPDVVQKEGRTYFVRGLGRVGDRTSYVDPANDVVYSGYDQRTHKISELDFE